MSTITKAYLALYNVACAAGWAYVFSVSLPHLREGSEAAAFYADVEFALQVVQTAAVLEVVHSMVGLVRSPWFTTLIQVASRITIVWAFLWPCPDSRSSVGAYLCITSWALVEVPRYLFYAANLFGSVPYPVFWLRYSLFAILYPTGITGEFLTIIAGLGYYRENGAMSDELPHFTLGDVEVTMYHFTVLCLCIWVPGAPYMYMNMVKNRRSAFKKLRGSAAVTGTKAD